ncbi:MAG: hypothetical protein KDF60_20610 [Calditrichaeota bacterium]|nr:hypothetical protein [Calditrichota bacterium]
MKKLQSTKETAGSKIPVERIVMRYISRLVDRNLLAWRIWNKWRNRKYIFESKKIDLRCKYLDWKIKRYIRKKGA